MITRKSALARAAVRYYSVAQSSFSRFRYRSLFPCLVHGPPTRCVDDTTFTLNIFEYYPIKLMSPREHFALTNRTSTLHASQHAIRRVDRFLMELHPRSESSRNSAVTRLPLSLRTSDPLFFPTHTIRSLCELRVRDRCGGACSALASNLSQYEK